MVKDLALNQSLNEGKAPKPRKAITPRTKRLRSPCPTFAQVTHRNRSMRQPAFLLQVDDGPLQSKLGFYEEEPLLGA
jgi:hypothetical protein